MKTIQLVFGCHSHQPVGNFGFVFEEAYDKSYKPFLDVLERFPKVKVVLHYTGPLFDWFAANRPEYLERLARLAQSGQVEIMGGAYYEPLLCAIPERDAIAQIGRMQRFCAEHFGKRPTGMWLTERVWEPHMPKILAKAGVAYTALDDSHFAVSGIPREECFGYYHTDDEGYTVRVFPIIEKLRYTIPFRPVEETIEFLREKATEDGSRCAVFHDDGEKFGVWPGTYHSVYEEGWLERLFEALTENSDWIKCVTYEEYLRTAPPVGRTYLTCASYSEMMEWALPAVPQRQLHSVEQEIAADPEKKARYGPFIRGGFWRNFLAKYPESNTMQKRMLRVSRRLEELRGRGVPGEALANAETLLHQAQCNCAYWHGVFGGLYLNHLRTALFECSIQADLALDVAEGTERSEVEITSYDMDCDGNDEVVMDSPSNTLFLAPADGGTLFEWDYKPRPFNLTNTLARREEAYHEHLLNAESKAGADGSDGTHSIHDIVHMKEEGLAAYLAYDQHRRSCLRDRFFPETTTVEQLWGERYTELSTLPGARYAATLAPEGVTLTGEGTLHDRPGAGLRVEKRLSLAAGASHLLVLYTVTNISDGPVAGYFGMDWAINLLTGSAPDRYYVSNDAELNKQTLGVRAQDEALTHLALVDEYLRLRFALQLSEPARVYRFPIETVSQSEGGQERVYQGSIIVPSWPVALQPGERAGFQVMASVESLD
ncbi:MAG: DUF1926 domain-containing protein [Candidatus Hydrogenedens sp.]|nr:DUF1926 domain-containing protein [Candidatus Hydrogenedens sp.]